MILKHGKRNQDPVIRESGHSPFQAFFGTRRGFANARMHLAQFSPCLFGSSTDVFSDIPRTRFVIHARILSVPARIPHSVLLTSLGICLQMFSELETNCQQAILLNKEISTSFSE